MTAINLEFDKELNRYGAFDFNVCYTFNNCTAVCSFMIKGD